MQTSSLLRVVLSLFLATVVSAQSTVPTSLQGIEGGGGTNNPFGSNLACRYQSVYEASTLPWSGPRMISGIRIRPDLNNGNATPQQGFLQVSVLMSTTSVTAETASTVFEDNYGADATWVMQTQPVMLPMQPMLPAGAVGPRPANIDLPFSTPWFFGLTPVISGQPEPENLLVEIHIHWQPNAGSYRIDGLTGCVAPNATFGMVGPQCARPGAPPIELGSDVSMLAGQLFNWKVSNASPSMPFMIMINLTDTGGLLGNPAWPLPYPMFDPANPSQPSQALLPLVYSAPDCYINVSPAMAISGVTDAMGEGEAGAILPGGTQNVGETFYAQAMVLEPQANQLFFITSLGYSSSICGPLGVARIVAFYDGSITPPPVPQSGNKSAGVAMVFDVY